MDVCCLHNGSLMHDLAEVNRGQIKQGMATTLPPSSQPVERTRPLRRCLGSSDPLRNQIPLSWVEYSPVLASNKWFVPHFGFRIVRPFIYTKWFDLVSRSACVPCLFESGWNSHFGPEIKITKEARKKFCSFKESHPSLPETF